MSKIDLTEFLDSVSSSSTSRISATSVALFLSSILRIKKRYLWEDNGNKLTDEQWDSVDGMIGEAIGEIVSNMVIGMIFPTVIVPDESNGILLCDGRTLQKADYPDLYDSLESEFIVDSSSFLLPDLRGKFVYGKQPADTVNTSGGEVSHVLSIDEIPAHSHGWSQYTFGIDIESVGVPDPTGVGQPELPRQTGVVGGGLSHNNMPPYVVLKYVIVAK